MIALRFAPRARADIEGIWNYTAERWNVDQSEAYLLAIDQAISPLRENPRLGRSANNIENGFFKFPVASHVIYYRLTSSRLDIIRVLHKRMDAEQHI